MIALTPAQAQVVDKADVTVSFDISQPGHRFTPTWGLDQAWISEQNLRKGLNHIGRENIGIGRSCFRTTDALVDDSILAGGQVNYLRRRNTMFNIISDTLPLVLTADQEAGSDEYYVTNRNCKADHWAANIVSHVHWLQENSKHPVVGVSIFNEPDYWTVEEGATVAKQTEIAKLLRQQPRMDSVALVGANTLNDDQALNWYTSGKQWFEWGNTHQLAGDFNHFANFYQQLAKDGKVGYADEMHNVGEAMIGLEYGMTVGIWWGFDSRARGEFCDISRNGERLAYGEHRNNWTAASVYRHDDGRVKAFVGSSERQAVTTTYQFVSLDRDVYFDGYGPTRQYRVEMPGGTGYQNGQTNAERVVDITWGDDVAPYAITEGQYKLVNKATGSVVAYSANGANIVQQRYTGAVRQHWTVKPCNIRCGGDYSFLDIEAVDNPKIRINVKNYSTGNADLIAWTQDKPTSNEQWYLQYMGNGYYYLRNRESALYMASAGTAVTARVVQTAMLSEANRDRMLWRLLPVGVDYETDAPAQPAMLTATPLPAAVRLAWEQGAEDDLDGYMVLRADKAINEWNTIARHATSPFTDNTTRPGHTYVYKVKAIDRAQNLSEASAETEVTTPEEKALVAHWTMNGTLDDQTENGMSVAAANDPVYGDSHREGVQGLRFTSNQYLQLPTDIVQGDEMTVALWVRAQGTSSWQRIFAFGHDSNNYVALTPYNGSRMQLSVKSDGVDQTLDCPTRLFTSSWKHVVVTIAPGRTAIYVDGSEVASTSAITNSLSDIRPVINYIGRSHNNSNPFFTGYMADVRIYNHALGADDVALLYNETSAITGIAADDKARPASVYSLDGRRREQPRRGLNIIDGKITVKGYDPRGTR